MTKAERVIYDKEYRQRPEVRARERKRWVTEEYKEVRSRRNHRTHQAMTKEECLVRADYRRLHRLAFPELWKRYRQTPEHRAKSRASVARFMRTTKGRIVLERYRRSEKGKARGCRNRATRRARERRAGVRDQRGIAKIYRHCAALRQEGLDIVVDHTIPLAKGGAHEPGNLQIILRVENLIKSDTLGFVPSIIYPVP